MGGKNSKAQHEAGLSPAPPGAKVLRAPSSPPPKRVLFKDEAAASSPASSSTQGVAVGDICTAESTRRAEELKALEQADRLASADGLSRFDKYRNFFKNHETELARDVQKLVTRANKRELRRWVAEHVGELRALDDYGKVELVELAMVSAAIAKHGERKLRQMDERGELAALPNMPLNTHDLRMESKQQACRAASKAARKDEMQAAHYVGLEVMMTLNARLPVDARVGDELREILNDPSNLRLVLAASNQSLHKKADTLLMVDYDAIQAADEADKKAKSKRNCPTAQEYARLVQVAKHAQSDAFQDAMKAAGGVELYCSLRDQFLRLDVGSRAVIWDVTKDKIVPRGRPVPSAVVIQVKLKATANKVADKGEKPKPRASRSPSPAVVAEKTVKKSTATQQTRGVATAREAKPEPKKTKAKKAAASKAEVASKTPAAAKKKAGEKKTKKAKDSPPKPEKENLNQENTPTTTSKKRPTTRRVTRSKGTAELVELPDTYSDGSEYVDESDSDYED